jgi:Spy/CpxP family protein refolding chaperone
MKRSVCLFTWFVVVVVSLSAVLAAEGEGKKKRRAKPKRQRPARLLRGSYAAIAKEINLDEAQIKKMADAIKARDAALKKWREDPAKGGKLKELSQQMRNPDVRQDKEKRKEIRAQMKPLQTELREAQTKLNAAVMAVLTPQQQQQWKTAVFYLNVTGRMRRAQLTDEQKAKAKELCTPVAKKIAALGPTDRKQRNQLMKGLQTSLEALLTPEQREKLKAQPKPRTKEGKQTRRKEAGTKRGRKKKDVQE